MSNRRSICAGRPFALSPGFEDLRIWRCIFSAHLPLSKSGRPRGTATPRATAAAVIRLVTHVVHTTSSITTSSSRKAEEGDRLFVWRSRLFSGTFVSLVSLVIHKPERFPDLALHWQSSARLVGTCTALDRGQYIQSQKQIEKHGD